MMIWWFCNHHNYLLGGVKFMFSSLLVCLSPCPCLLPLSGSLPLSLSPFAPPCHPPQPITPTPAPTLFSLLLFSSLLSSSFLFSSLLSLLSLSVSPSLSPSLSVSQHGKLGTSNMFVCSVPHITENISITTYFYKVSLTKCSTVLTFVIFLVHMSLYNKKQPEYTDARGCRHTHTHTSRSLVVFHHVAHRYPKLFNVRTCPWMGGTNRWNGVNISYQNYRRYETQHFWWSYLLQINFLCNSFHRRLDRILFAW